MAERIVEEIAIVVRVTIADGESGAGGASVIPLAISGSSSDKSFGDLFTTGLQSRLKSFAFGQINTIFRQALTSLLSGKKKTVTTSSSGGDSQFSPPQSASQSSADLARMVARGERNS